MFETIHEHKCARPVVISTDKLPMCKVNIRHRFHVCTACVRFSTHTNTHSLVSVVMYFMLACVLRLFNTTGAEYSFASSRHTLAAADVDEQISSFDMEMFIRMHTDRYDWTNRYHSIVHMTDANANS